MVRYRTFQLRRSLLEELSRVADVFARSFLLVVEDIPRVFGMALK